VQKLEQTVKGYTKHCTKNTGLSFNASDAIVNSVRRNLPEKKTYLT
jgi:hypothetical protein